MNIESFFYARLCLMLAKIGTIQADSHSLIDNSKTISSRTTTRKLIASVSLKFILPSFLLCILFALNLSAQTNTTSPLPLLEEGKQWATAYHVGLESPGPDGLRVETKTIMLLGDTVVNGHNYNKVYITYKEDLDDLRHAYNIREENGKVYICGNSSDTDNPEYLWFDFTLGVGDKITNECAKLDNVDLTLDATVVSIETMVLNDGILRKKWTVHAKPRENSEADYLTYEYIEGVGLQKEGIEPFPQDWFAGHTPYCLLCVHNADGTVIYDAGYGCYTELVGIKKVTTHKMEQKHSGCYDVSGRRLLTAPVKGLYILDGKVMR